MPFFTNTTLMVEKDGKRRFVTVGRRPDGSKLTMHIGDKSINGTTKALRAGYDANWAIGGNRKGNPKIVRDDADKRLYVIISSKPEEDNGRGLISAPEGQIVNLIDYAVGPTEENPHWNVAVLKAQPGDAFCVQRTDRRESTYYVVDGERNVRSADGAKGLELCNNIKASLQLPTIGTKRWRPIANA